MPLNTRIGDNQQFANPLAQLQQTLAQYTQPQQLPNSPLLPPAADPQQQQPVQPNQPQQVAANLGMYQAQLLAGARQQQLAQALMEQGYRPNSGGLGAFAQVFSGLQAGKLERRAGEKISDAMGRKVDEENKQRLAEIERVKAEKVEEERRNSMLRREEKAAPGWSDDPTSVKEFNYAKDNPAFGAFLAADAAAKSPKTFIDARGPQANEFQQAIGKYQAESLGKWQDDAISAQNALGKIAKLRQISTLEKTGRVQEANAIIGELFGTEAAANRQVYKAIVGPMVIEIAKALKPMSNADIIGVEKMMPRFSNTPAANKQILDALEDAANRQVNLYESAAQYADDKQSLSGFRPSYDAKPRGERIPAAGAVTAGLNAEEQAELVRLRASVGKK